MADRGRRAHRDFRAARRLVLRRRGRLLGRSLDADGDATWRARRQCRVVTTGQREQLSGLATSERPEGWERFMAHGWFMNGRIEGDALAIDYHFNSPKNPQTYAVRGAISATPDWRYVRLRIDAHAPWVDWWMLLAIGGFATLQLTSGRAGLPAALATVALVLAVYAAANLVYIPSVVRDRVAGAVATELRGSVRHGPRWIVPK